MTTQHDPNPQDPKPLLPPQYLDTPEERQNIARYEHEKRKHLLFLVKSYSVAIFLMCRGHKAYGRTSAGEFVFDRGARDEYPSYHAAKAYLSALQVQDAEELLSLLPTQEFHDGAAWPPANWEEDGAK